MANEYTDLYSVIEFPEGFSFANYSAGERNLLNPLIRQAGYLVEKWITGERDAFGPLSRVCYATKDGKLHKLVYG